MVAVVEKNYKVGSDPKTWGPPLKPAPTPTPTPPRTPAPRSFGEQTGLLVIVMVLILVFCGLSGLLVGGVYMLFKGNPAVALLSLFAFSAVGNLLDAKQDRKDFGLTLYVSTALAVATLVALMYGSLYMFRSGKVAQGTALGVIPVLTVVLVITGFVLAIVTRRREFKAQQQAQQQAQQRAQQ
jgi:ABC-type multidrug transport system fused ATPase/permease subunit